MAHRALVLGLLSLAALGTASMPARADTPVPGTIRVENNWEVLQTGAGGRSLELMYVGDGGCRGPVRSAVAETPGSVTIQVWQDAPAGIVCPAIAMLGRLTVALGAPIAGRPILGRRTRLSGLFLPGRVIHKRRYVSTPRLTGLAPADAKRAVRVLASLRPVLRHGRRLAGLPRIVAQSPAAGHLVAENGTISLVAR